MNSVCDGNFNQDDDLPIKTSDGDCFWYQNEIVHRIGGPAAIFADGTEVWYSHGKLHRDNGPAVVSRDGEIWICDGIIHLVFDRKNGYLIPPEKEDGNWWRFDGQELIRSHVKMLGELSVIFERVLYAGDYELLNDRDSGIKLLSTILFSDNESEQTLFVLKNR